jgi:hypothetical protein
MTEIKANYDETWKEAINDYFDSFLSFFFPKVYQLIDWEKKPVSLDKELQQITASSKDSKRLADKLFKVWLKDNREVWILIHIEVQSQYEKDFAQRMYIYNYRAFDLYQKPVISLVILGDESYSWRPSSYNYNLGECEMSLKFPTVKLIDYEEKWHELETEKNVFAIIVMAHLKTKSTTNDLVLREEWKWNLVRLLYEKGYQKKDIIKLFKIIDLMMKLPEKLQNKLEQKIINYEEEKTMPLLCNMELRGMEKGMEKGIKKGIQKTLQENIIMILEKRFGNISTDLITRINRLNNVTQLQEIFKEIITINSISEVETLIKNI